jgi:uncharacterized protein YndB with AHSA1/START domain
MPYARHSVDIKAPVRRVFDMVAQQPERYAEWWPSITLQRRITPEPTTQGSICRFVFDVAGVRIKGEHQVAVLAPNSRLLIETISGMNASFDFLFEIVTGGTRVTASVYFSLPGPTMAQLLNGATIEECNQVNLQNGLRALKTMIEQEEAAV